VTLSLGSTALGSEGLPTTLLSNPPAVTVTAPTGTVTSTTVTVTWSYLSDIGRPHLTYRVRLLTLEDATLYDSGFLAGAGTSHDVPYLLSGFSTYEVIVEADDGIDVGTGAETFFVELSDVADVPAEPLVGSVYEVGVNGVGFMLADHPEQNTRYRRQTRSGSPPARPRSRRRSSGTRSSGIRTGLPAPANGSGRSRPLTPPGTSTRRT
jgi:hypothetical protein